MLASPFRIRGWSINYQGGQNFRHNFLPHTLIFFAHYGNFITILIIPKLWVVKLRTLSVIYREISSHSWGTNFGRLTWFMKRCIHSEKKNAGTYTKVTYLNENWGHETFSGIKSYEFRLYKQSREENTISKKIETINPSWLPLALTKLKTILNMHWYYPV